MSRLRIIELEGQLARRDARIAELEVAIDAMSVELAKPKAAPDLLEALETLIDVVGLTAIKYEGQKKVLADVVQISRAALNKAKGVTP
jgi:uncharacterized coiled-coil protein SlyX